MRSIIESGKLEFIKYVLHHGFVLDQDLTTNQKKSWDQKLDPQISALLKEKGLMDVS